MEKRKKSKHLERSPKLSEKSVGSAIVGITSKEQPAYTAGEILDEMGKGIIEYLEEAVERGCEKYGSRPFYILHLFKKELSYLGVENVMLQKAACFENRKWTPSEVMAAHNSPVKTLYKVDPKNGTVTLLWTVPSMDECKIVLKTPQIYDKDLVKWCRQALS